MRKQYKPTAFRYAWDGFSVTILYGMTFRYIAKERKSTLVAKGWTASKSNVFYPPSAKPTTNWVPLSDHPRGGAGKTKLAARPEVRGLAKWGEWPKGWVNAHRAKQHAARVTRRKVNQALVCGKWDDDDFNPRMQLCVPWYDMV